jgi:hypothetical protein
MVDVDDSASAASPSGDGLGAGEAPQGWAVVRPCTATCELDARLEQRSHGGSAIRSGIISAG